MGAAWRCTAHTCPRSALASSWAAPAKRGPTRLASLIADCIAFNERLRFVVLGDMRAETADEPHGPVTR